MSVSECENCGGRDESINYSVSICDAKLHYLCASCIDHYGECTECRRCRGCGQIECDGSAGMYCIKGDEDEEEWREENESE